MQAIDEATVEQTWQDVCGYGADQATEEMTRLGERQPAILAFVMALAEDLGDDAIDLAIYMLFVVYQVFSRSGADLRQKVTAEQLKRQLEITRDQMAEMPHGADVMDELGALAEDSSQPRVMRYVVDSLIEAPLTADPVALDDHAARELFTILKTVVDLLDRGAGGQPAQ